MGDNKNIEQELKEIKEIEKYRLLIDLYKEQLAMNIITKTDYSSKLREIDENINHIKVADRRTW